MALFGLLSVLWNYFLYIIWPVTILKTLEKYERLRVLFHFLDLRKPIL